MSRQTMSMEAALDEERKDVLALLEATNQSTRAQRGSASSTGSGERVRASSPFTANPRSPVRSMLDIGGEAPRHASIAGTSGGVTSPRAPFRSMLDIDSPPISPGPVSTRSAQTSPTDVAHRTKSLSSVKIHPRSNSDAAVRPADFGPHRAQGGAKGDLESDYQFSGYLPSNPGGPVIPKRNTLAGKRPAGSASMVAAMRGEDPLAPGLFGQKDRGRNPSIASAIGNNQSRSPHNRLGIRSNSPHSSMLNSNSTSNNTKTFALDNGTMVDMNSAYRRLSDANLALAGGSLANLATKRKGHRDSGDGVYPDEGRLEKDYTYAEEDALAESSDDYDSSDEENRGRRKEGRGNEAEMEDDPESSTIGMGRAKGPRQAKSLMAAAEEERRAVAEIQKKRQYKVRSLLEPEITVTGPTGSLVKSPRSGIHPTTAFDQGGVSGSVTPADSDTEAEITDIRRAQKLNLSMTPIISTPDSARCVRTIYRGRFDKMQEEAEANQRRVRKYLVATDLSDEAAHALEWTVGTVLRDGDTLLAIYCVDEETGIIRGEDLATPGAIEADKQIITKQAIAAAADTNRSSTAAMANATLHMPSPLNMSHSRGSGSAANSPMGRERGRAEQERFRAVEDITDRVSRLLRRTKLQVRVVIEVIHCKSPKHLITEVIDFISPTLVILGSRGRSALKGVILGSFSNYLVTKSSVPVMVARKRLRKHSKYRRPSVRLANNLSGVGAKSLASAKID